MSNNGYGYFTPPPSPPYHTVGNEINSFGQNNYIRDKFGGSMQDFLNTQYGPCIDALFDPGRSILAYKSNRGMFAIPLVCHNNGVCIVQGSNGMQYTVQIPNKQPTDPGWLSYPNQRRGGKMKKSMRRKSLRKRKTLRRRKIYK